MSLAPCTAIDTGSSVRWVTWAPPEFLDVALQRAVQMPALPVVTQGPSLSFSGLEAISPRQAAGDHDDIPARLRDEDEALQLASPLEIDVEMLAVDGKIESPLMESQRSVSGNTIGALMKDASP